MSSGGDPERGDEFGLPQVDVKIPDDARELDRDVQAYHRELRALRRRRLARRLSAPLTGHGLLLPLLASSLALTLLAGTLLTLLSASQGSWFPAPRLSASASAGPSQPRSSAAAGRPLPDANVLADGEDMPLRQVAARSVLAVVRPGCRCQRAVRQLARQAAAARVRMVVLGIGGVQPAALARQAGLRATSAVADTGNVLGSYFPPDVLTAILVWRGGNVARIVPAQAGGFRLGTALHALAAGRPLGLPRGA